MRAQSGGVIVWAVIFVLILLVGVSSALGAPPRKNSSSPAGSIATLAAKARVQLDTGEYFSARKTYLSALAILDDGPPDLRAAMTLGLAEALVGLREYERAQEVLAALIDSLPGGEWTVRGRSQAGEIALRARDFRNAEVLLEEAMAGAERSPETQVLQLQLAECAFRQGEWEEAIRRFTSCEVGDALLVPFVQLRLGAGLARVGQVEEALRLLEELTDQAGDEWLVASARREIFDIQQENGMWEEALESGLLLQGRSRDRIDMGSLLYRMGRCQEERGRMEEAEELYGQVIRDHWSSEGGILARERLEELKRLDMSDRYHAGMAAYAAERYRTAISDFSIYLRRFPNGPHAVEALYWKGRALYSRRRFSDARAAFRELIRSSTGPDYGARGLYYFAHCNVRLGRDEEAVAAYRRLAARYPSNSLADDGLYRIGRIYEDAGEMDEAAKAYVETGRQFPHGDMAPSALYRRGLLGIRERDWEGAAGVLASCGRLYPGTEEGVAATYWLGRCRERTGERSEAVAAYESLIESTPRHYYASLAAERLRALEQALALDPGVDSGTDPRDGMQFLPIAAPPPIDPGAWLSSWIDRGVGREMNRRLPPAGGRGQALAAVGLIDAAQEELEGLDPAGDPSQAYQAARAARAAGLDHRAISYAQKVVDHAARQGRQDLPKELLELLYPASFAGLVDEAASSYGVDRCLVLALIREESRFDPFALSSAHAMGLMQIIAPTARKLARVLDVKSFAIDDLYRPSVSIGFGTYYLSELLGEFGRPELALAAYNAGEGRVRTWLEQYDAEQIDLFVEEIPFSETRGYVKRVMGSYHVYQALWGTRLTRGGRDSTG
jgi:soluble lytic murein transglycosylase